MNRQLNLVRVFSSTTSTGGPLALGAAVPGFVTPAQTNPPGVDGQTYSYGIEADFVDGVAVQREQGTGILGNGGTTITRGTVASTNGNAPLDLTGDQEVLITPINSDFLEGTTGAVGNAILRASGGAGNALKGSPATLDDNGTLHGVTALPNAASIQGELIDLGPPDYDVLLGFDFSMDAYKPFLLVNIANNANPAAGDFLLMYGSAGSLQRANWSKLPTVSPAGIEGSIQFNLSGAFAGTGDFTWVTGLGLTIGGATESMGVITPGTSEAIVAGNFGVIGIVPDAPGDPLDPSLQNFDFAIGACSYLNGDYSGKSTIGYYGGLGISQSGGDSSAVFQTAIFNLNVNTDSTGDISVIAGMNGVCSSIAPVNIDLNAGLRYRAEQGDGNATILSGLYVDTFLQPSGIVSGAMPSANRHFGGYFGPTTTDADISEFSVGVYAQPYYANCNVPYIEGFYCFVGFDGGTCIQLATFYAGAPSPFSGTVDQVVGLYIEDHSGKGVSESTNIHSVGATSLNVFEGILQLGTATNASPVDGQIWYDGTDFKARTGGATKTFILI